MNRQLFSLFTGKVVDSVRTFLVKNTPQGCNQMNVEYDCLWKSASGAQSELSPSRIERFREF